jgi:hypothetical protein
MILKIFRNFAKFPLFKDVNDPLWPPNGNSQLAKEHTASTNRRNIQLFLFNLSFMPCVVVSGLKIEEQLNPWLVSK